MTIPFHVKDSIYEIRSDLATALVAAKEDGRRVVGTLCSYSPVELALAAGAIPVSLCGTTQEGIAKAEETLPVDLCPKVKSTYGRAVSGACPIFPLADCIIAEATCDGRKKMYELLAREKPLLVMDLPQKSEDPDALPHWVAEVEKSRRFIEQQLKVTITEDALRDAIRKWNQVRRLRRDLHYRRNALPTPIMGVDFVNIMTKLENFVDVDAHIAALTRFRDELDRAIGEKTAACGDDRPRVLWTGLGASLGCNKVMELVESCGAVVVCQEGCGGLTRVEDLVDEDEAKDPILAIAERYLRVTCACMTPNTQRFTDLQRLIGEFEVDGVLDLTWQFCARAKVGFLLSSRQSG
ncbi:benzoyl-CoA reductase/2-hydroxyglutaryl-CoA dehydratase subunit BcrC/BadD/HgdB [Rhodoblastus acidophilus]|uniref:double-cubane-cluster-containing anaerobic reductase n=1 Tax=Rhodoblastus acidophilus TaxID=1074 RepID=UPI002224C6A9|nr:double-cubane-cluster-containing anaerobic reductase [Rhodoblastus acidophilus]MCW2285429.1 benzoyl-CoA reductase/2-hydroxyglutaryl-CoA dehydratase subunit BcrC/BadD/HgdB [Rhodoblastus acidophilus]MCW2334322.1 benzoyl-CoA reductase/2-hydroxyglutaryl-CoA dehydratase subunit BcrC/BadD/HgdB [Rhodoblastus acidophilus]